MIQNDSMLKPITNREYIARMIIIILSFLTPIFCIMTHGILPSLSRYWSTDLQPLFVITNIVTAYYFFNLKRWKFAAIFLLLLTSFSVEMYNTMHNLLALGFFLSVLYPFIKIHHYKWCLWIYLGSVVILPFNMMFFEMAAITIICLYHSLVLYKVNKLIKKKNDPIK